MPPLRIEGGEKCHHVLVSFRKQFSYLRSAYKVLEEGLKKKICNLMQINSVLVGFDGAGYT